MKNKIIISLLFFACLLVSCGSNIPNDLSEQLSKVLDEGSTLTALTTQGVNFGDFSNQLAKTRGAYDLAVSLELEKYLPEAKEDFDKAFQGWDLALYMWNAKIQGLDNPVEPDINKYYDILYYGAGEIVRDIHPADYLVEDYRGKLFLPFDENISILLSLASENFENGQVLTLEAMK